MPQPILEPTQVITTQPISPSQPDSQTDNTVSGIFWTPPITKGVWSVHTITINDVSFNVIRRPRVFELLDFLRSTAPNSEALSQYQFELMEDVVPSWVFEFDIDHHGTKKTLKLVMPWPNGILTLEQALADNMKEFYHEGIITFLDNTLFPLKVSFLETQKTGTLLQMGIHGDGFTTAFPVFMEFRLFEEVPFGLLDRDEPKSRPETISDSTTAKRKKIRHIISVSQAQQDFGVSKSTIEAWLRGEAPPAGFTLDSETEYRICLGVYRRLRTTVASEREHRRTSSGAVRGRIARLPGQYEDVDPNTVDHRPGDDIA
jgi:hypothetical protein